MGRKKVTPEFYSIPTLCECGCGKNVMNPDDHYRYRKFLPGHYDNTGEKHPRFGVKEPQDKLEKRIETLKNTLKSRPPTCLERDLYVYLDRKGAFFVRQLRIKSTIVDAYLPDYNLCVFADGVFWHSKPEMIERDARHVKMLTDMGYSVLRLKSINNGHNLDFSPLKEIID